LFFSPFPPISPLFYFSKAMLPDLVWGHNKKMAFLVRTPYHRHCTPSSSSTATTAATAAATATATATAAATCIVERFTLVN
jgi:hypothetical protein